MTQNYYLQNVLASKKAPPINLNDWRLMRVKSALTEWAGYHLSRLKESGSSAKGTAIHGIGDFDIFISLKSDTPKTLKEAYYELETFMQSKGFMS